MVRKLLARRLVAIHGQRHPWIYDCDWIISAMGKRVGDSRPPRSYRRAAEEHLARHVKTWYLYSMSSRLVNVRLDEERVRKAKALREKGISLSDLIRTAIDERYERALSTRGPRDVRAIFERLDAEYPIAAKDLPSLKYDVHDRRQVAAAIRRGLDRRRGRRSSG